MSDYKIVCVDDDLDVLEAQSQKVNESGYETVTFSKPQEAIEYIAENKDQILMILSDLKMDKVSGFDLKKEVNKIAKEVPYLVITGYWTKEMSAIALDLGIQAFLEKPLKLDVLNEYIEKYVQERKEGLDDQKEMVEGFIEESSSMLDEIESLILELEEDPESEQTLSVYFRLLHTIKGTASCVGLNELANYAHKYEDFINELKNKTINVSTETTNALLFGLDDLKQYYVHIQTKYSDTNAVDQDRLKMFDPAAYAGGQAPKVEEKTSQKKKEASAPSPKKEEDKMTVSMNILNNFMEESGELTVIRNTILKTVKSIESRYRGDTDVELLNELLVGMHNVTSNIQGKIVEMRKVPLKNTFRPFRRLVRDISKQLGKEVELTVVGEELSVDNIVAKLYSNTMIHILRNSLDHGLETSEERIKNGKDPVGKLEIKVEEVGEDIVLEVIDDGKGINPEIIRQKALEKGLFTEAQLSKMSQLEIINIIFASGFSTAEKVSDLSGRGVGMDMVRGSFEEMGGEIIVFSEVNKGSKFRLKVPIPKSVLIINTLSVRVNKEFYIFHMDEVAEVVRYESDSENSKMYEINNQKMLSHNGETIQLLYLSDLLEQEKNEDEVHSIVILRVGDSKYGVIVDEIYEFEEVVSRKIHDSINDRNIYHGAALLGTGQVAMIISAQGLAEYRQLEIHEKKKSYEMDADELMMNESYEEYMLFKYDSSNYLGIELDSVNRLETLNASSFEKVGNNTVVNYRGRVLPLIDPAYKIGLHETSLVDDVYGKDEKVEVIIGQFQDRFIGLCVYGLDEIKKVFEELNSETIDMEGLKGSVYLEGKTICVINIEFLFEQLNKKITLEERTDNILEINIPSEESDSIAA